MLAASTGVDPCISSFLSMHTSHFVVDSIWIPSRPLPPLSRQSASTLMSNALPNRVSARSVARLIVAPPRVLTCSGVFQKRLKDSTCTFHPDGKVALSRVSYISTRQSHFSSISHNKSRAERRRLPLQDCVSKRDCSSEASSTLVKMAQDRDILSDE